MIHNWPRLLWHSKSVFTCLHVLSVLFPLRLSVTLLRHHILDAWLCSLQYQLMLGVETLIPSTSEVEAGGSLWVQCQLGWHTEDQGQPGLHTEAHLKQTTTTTTTKASPPHYNGQHIYSPPPNTSANTERELYVSPNNHTAKKILHKQSKKHTIKAPWYLLITTLFHFWTEVINILCTAPSAGRR